MKGIVNIRKTFINGKPVYRGEEVYVPEQLVELYNDRINFLEEPKVMVQEKEKKTKTNFRGIKKNESRNTKYN